MKNPFRHDTAFRVTFALLVAAALITLAAECSTLPPGPSRVQWPADSTGTTKP